MKRLRFTVFGRLLLILVGVAALPTALVIALQERALVADLEEAAAKRLERAGRAAGGLLDAHVDGLAERTRAISGTPQFRATLELGDEATLRFYAAELARRAGAAAIAFVPTEGAPVAAGPEPQLVAHAAPEAARGGEAPHEPASSLFAVDGRPYVRARVPLRTGGSSLGSLVVVERLDEARLADWSETCGARVGFESAAAASASTEGLVREVRRVGGGRLTVHSTLAAERRALAHARRNLLAAGAVALAVAFLASVLLSRSWVRPIVAMRRAAERIARGDFGIGIESRRRDEIGDVARSFDHMGERLRAYRAQVDDQQRALEDKVRELDRNRERLRSAQRLARMGSWRMDPELGEVEVSEELAELVGLGAAVSVRWKDLLASVHPEDRGGLVEAARRCLEEDRSLHVQHRLTLADGSERILQVQARRLRDLDGETTLLEGTVQDVTERRRAEDQVRFLARHDGLTGLGNRRLFDERIQLAIARARRTGTGFGVLFLDLDHFKRINDTLGHSVGDRLLRGVADRLVGTLRESDLVARQDLATAVSRFGGDEFTLLVDELDQPADLAKVARRLLESVSRPFTLEGHEIVIKASIGIAAWPADGADGEALLRNADAAMHHAKEQGRDNLQFYAASMNQAALQRLILESRLRRALESDEFEVHYQPKLDAAGRRLLGVEALARWRDPELGVVMPGEFIPIAEETGLVVALGDRVLRRACEDRRRWSGAGLPPIPVAVNLSAHQFRGGRLAERVLRILEEAGLAPELLEIEITESTLLHDEATVAETLHALRERGARVALDDFGTGYSSLAYLGGLPVDALKIDRRFVQGIAERPGEAALASAIVAMGRALRLTVVAEGVETEAQRRLLEDWGCDELQGFLFAHPMPDAALRDWWRRLDSSGAT